MLSQGPGIIAATPSHTHVVLLLCSKSATTARGFETLRAEPNEFRIHLLSRSDTLSCFGENAGGGTKCSGLLPGTSISSWFPVVGGEWCRPLRLSSGVGVNRRVRPTPKNGVAQPLLVTAPPREMLEEEEEEEDEGGQGKRSHGEV